MKALAFLLLASTMLSDGFFTSRAVGQDDSRKTPTMRQSVYDKLSKSSGLADRGDMAGALAALEDLKKFKDLSPYEKAQLHTAFGFVHYSRGEYGKSVDSYRVVLDQEELPAALRASTLYTLAQIHYQMEQYAKTVEYLDRWIGEAANPGPEPYMLLGQARYELERYGEAIDPIETAVRISRGRGRKVDEAWYMLLRACHYALGDYPRTIEVLETLVSEYPREEYWTQLAALYGDAGNERRRLAAYELAYLQGYLDERREIVLLAQLLLQAGVPYRAGAVLARGLADGFVEGTAEEYGLLSQAWTLAKEDGKAIEALTRAAALTDDGEFDARLAYAHADRSEWEKAAESARTALARGVAERARIQVLLGMALFELEKFEEAKKAFQVARSSPDMRRTAARWVDYIESERIRISELERSFGR